MARPDQIADPELRSQIEAARTQMRSGDGTAAVHTLVDAFLYMLRKRPELLEVGAPGRFGQMPVIMRWPNLGANLSRESVMAKAPQIEFVRDHFAVSEAITYYEFTLETAVSQGL
ncbi:MAG TPA: hypothetical protein VNN10_09325 [Dehalococcoidia bacterium]|nr:hypothetical protein [Dehalococcoidia bacterium]